MVDLVVPRHRASLTPGRARAFAALVERYSKNWTGALLAEWRSSDRPWTRIGGRDRLSWLASLPRLCEALRGADEAVGKLAARLLLQDQWKWLQDLIEETLCATLEAFLSDPGEQRLEWPIAKAKRMHVHQRLDAHEMPVRHETRRSGSPYTLVLTKTKDLFAREAGERRSFQADLEWLRSSPRPS